MKKFIGTKVIMAEPMTMVEAQKVLGREIKPATVEEDGYLVEYKDGYKSWSPKSVFEEAYKLSETFLDRMKVEFDVEFAKWDKGDTFIRSKKFNELPLISRVLLYAQNKTQKQFCDLLESRIDVANNNDLMLYAFNFSTAISLLKAGAAVRREDWKNSNAFVVKQIPSHIKEDIIPKMQSLPQSAKDILMARKHPEIKYRNQLLIIGEDGIADSWHPTPDDIFAEDWMIVTDEC